MMIGGAFFASCNDDNGGPGDWDGESVTVDCDPYDSWTYFNLESGTVVQTLKVVSQVGAVEGRYYGDIEGRMLTIQNPDSLLMTISRGEGDAITVSFPAVQLTNGMGDNAAIVDAYFTIEGTAVKEGDNWLVNCPSEDYWIYKTLEDNSLDSTEYRISLTGTIGATENSTFALHLSLCPTAMAEMGASMDLGGDYTGAATGRSFALNGDETSFDWDLAFHRYEIKTNGGAAVMLNATDLNSVTVSSVAGETFTEDVDGSVIVDMSGMMQGYIGYQETKYNAVLGQWVTATPTGSMPPYVYEVNYKVFVVRLADGTYAKIQFTDMSDASGRNEACSFNYEYPLQ